MNVCLNALYFVPGKMGGTETYFRELVRHLPLAGCDDAFTVFTNTKYRGEFNGIEGVEVKSVVRYERPDARWFFRGIMHKSIGIDLYAPKLAKVKADIIHYPFTIMTPQVTDRPTVLTFWDMQHEFYPEFFSKKDLEFRSKMYKKSVQQATCVIVSAEFTKQCLVERYAIDQNKIKVVHTGYSPDFRVIRNDPEINDVRARYGLDRPFMYYPAATWPHKNHCLLLEALKLLVDRRHFDGMLVLSGVAMNQHGEIMQKVRTLGIEKHVKVLGYLPYADLPYLYNMARLMVFPSLFEGFGIPLVEAMACGCPVVASNCTSIPEVVSDSGKLFDPTSIEDISATIWDIWSSENELSDMSEKGLRRVTKFTWEETAHKTLGVYYKAWH